MPLTPSDLPLLLAGPILRRVEADLVSVWIATSRPCDVSLFLFDEADVVGMNSGTDDPRAKWVSDEQSTRQVGANLHVLTVVLDLRTPGGNAVRSHGAELQPNLTYSYDLRIFDSVTRHSLRTLKLLDVPTPLGYDINELPSFVMCPQDLDRLVIVHGSCRQLFAAPPVQDDPVDDDERFFPPGEWRGGWPGEEPTVSSPKYKSPKLTEENLDTFPDDTYPYLPKRDGMLWIDELIAARGPTAFVDRPHQLFLTGDQIYADQPSAVLLPVLNHLGRLLVGPEDTGLSPTGDLFAHVTLENFPPEFRGDIVRRSGGLTTSDGGSHLLSFGEFVAYYLLTWSPELWEKLGNNLWPADFTAANVVMPEDWRVRFLYDDDRGIGSFSDAYQEFLKNLPDDAPGRDASPDEHAQYYFKQRLEFVADKYWSPELFEWWMRRFRQQVPRVRRALANVPTYMVADDHDVSDDWYFSRQWREQVFTRPQGVDIVRNGMMACSLMQSWGNDPRRWAAGPELELLDRIGEYAPLMAAALATRPSLDRTRLDRLHELLGLPHTTANGAPPTFRALVEYSFQIEGPCHRVLAIDGRTKRRFPTRTSQAGGIDYEGATGRLNDDLPTGLPGEEATGLFGDSPMAAALPPRPAGDTKQTIVVTGVPVIGPEGMELALLPFQRLARLLGDVDAESWSYEPATYEALLAALARYESVVLLSGDIHIGYSAVLDYWSAPPGGPVRTARIAQLVSSGLTKDWGNLSPPLRNHALTLDVFESATNPALMHAERVGWGSPLRTELTPPTPLGSLVTHPERAHPFYRARLKTPAPVVPTHGWPAGTQEVREPNWAWRAAMVRDPRPETMSDPTLARRWTPVDLPPDQLDPQAMGWHSHAARKMAYGRVFAVNTNVGIVTFERVGAAWSVRHVLAGELPPMRETGTAPTGLQPFIVHQFTLAPLVPASWDTERPKIVDDGGWGVDTTEPTFHLLVECLPRIWAGAAAFSSAVYADLPPVVDEVTREALITDAATRVSGPFRRRVLRALGPFSLLPDGNLDAVTNDQVAALFSRIGRLNADKEARALIRPDLERLLAFHQSLDTPAAMFDDLLLLACSEWVYDRNSVISTIAGVIATFRSPVTKHVPILQVLLGGLWDLWRNRTFAEHWTKGAASPALAGLLALPPRIVMFAVDLVLELVINLVQDLEPRFNGGPAVLTPEIFQTALGTTLSLMLSKRFTFVSGWEPVQTPLTPGTRATGRTPEALARQTLTMIVYPDNRARHEPPAQKVSVTMVPPETSSSDEEEAAGSLLIGYDGGLETEFGAGAMKARFELDGRAFHRIMWGGSRFIDGRLGRGAVRATLLFPTRLNTGVGVHIAFTPSISLALELLGGPAEDSFKPGVTLRLALNDVEDRVTFIPDDEFIGQLLPRGGLALPIDAAWEWTLENGWRFAGFGQLSTAVLDDPTAPKREKPVATPPPPSGQQPPASDLDEPPAVGPIAEVVTPLNTRLGVLSFHERRLEVTTGADDTGVSFDLTVSATVSVNIGPVRIAIAGLGVTGSLRLRNEFENADELVDFTVGVPMPTALAVSINTDSVAGGGFLQRIEDPSGAVTWRGGLALRLGERVEVTAFGIIQTGGGKPWSLLVLLMIRFTPPIRLSDGLRLVAVGGLVALNRTMDLNALSNAARATTSQSNLDALLFPDRAEERFLELVPALDRFFPVAPGHQVIGLMAELEWRADSGTTFGDFRLALLAELDSAQLALFGIARLGFPSVDEPSVLRVRASIEALYDHRAKLASFAITLTEAFLFERIHLTGGAALLIRWGDHPDYALTLGGFHPAYRPFIPQGLREPPRVGAFWKPHDQIELSLQLYFARTAFSMQFGFAAHVKAGASWGGIRADAEFNFLVMIAPEPRFEVDLSLRVTAFLFGADLISASFSGSLTGPRRWRLEGSVYWEVCGVSVSKDLGPYYWGDPPRRSETQQEARQLLGDTLGDTGNWTIRRSPVLPVRLRPAAQDALEPRDEIDIRQALLPLGVPVEVNDANPLSDGGTWTLRPTTASVAKVADLTDVFPTRRFIKRPPKHEPFRDGLVSGVRVGGTGFTLQAALAVVSDEDVDRGSRPRQSAEAAQTRTRACPRAVFEGGARGGAVPIARATLDAPHASTGGHATGGHRMKLWLLPHVREGMTPTAVASGRPQVNVSLTLESQGRTPRGITHLMPMLGPGDVVGIETRQVLRVTPTAGTRDAEPDFFPAIEFDAPDLPWAYSPVTLDQPRVLPWIVLVVLEITPDVVLAPGERGQSPSILRLNESTARRELPELIDTWAWAHAQVACDTPGDINNTLAQHPDRTLSRLIAARRLLPFRLYRACVVPAFLTGLIAGLGEESPGGPTVVTGLEPAWSASHMPAAIPVYYSWTFRTGEAGDFESLAQRLHAAPLDASIPPTPLHLSLPAGDGQLTVDWEPPLRVPGTKPTTPPRPPAALSQITAALRPGTPARPVLGPAYFGSPWTDERALTPVTDWPAALNATPMLRAAAGLGADAVRAEQEALVTAASRQLEAFRAKQREGRRRQLAATVLNRVKLRLSQAPLSETTRVFAPIAVRAQLAASNAGLYTASGRRIVRKVPTVRVGLHLSGGGVVAPLSDITTADLVVAPLPGVEMTVLIPAIEYRTAVERIPVVELPPPVAPVDPTTISTGSFAPRFDRPLSEVLADRHPELMLPGTDAIAADGVLLVQSHADFVEAFLVGANQEIGYELLWRGLPADSRGTAFKRFWAHSEGRTDIGDISTWDVTTPVGSHLVTSASMVLVVRSELARRYPTVLIAAVPAGWNRDGSRSPLKDPTKLVLPAFRGRIGADVLYAGFSQPTLVEAIGGITPLGDAGWFFLLSENPGDPRFGLDPVAVTTQPTRATLAWTHLGLPADARYATAAAFPPVPDANFSPAQATAAQIASLTRQRPFRAFLHGSMLVRLPSPS